MILSLRLGGHRDHEAEGEVPNDGGKHRVRQSQQEELKEGAWPEPGQATLDTKRRSSSNPVVPIESVAAKPGVLSPGKAEPLHQVAS